MWVPWSCLVGSISSETVCEFPKVRDTFLGGPCNKDPTIYPFRFVSGPPLPTAQPRLGCDTLGFRVQGLGLGSSELPPNRFARP